MSQVRDHILKESLTLIAVGSNATSPWGSAFETVVEALRRLEEAVGVTLIRSRLYQTPAFPAGAGPDFVNGAVAVRATMPAAGILAILHGIEHAAARTRAARWGQRTLDFDLIAQGDLVQPDRDTVQAWLALSLEDQQRNAPDQLILPHPRVQDRAFVLQPLSDVAPDWMHPILGLTVMQMLVGCTAEDRASVVPIG